MTDREISNIKKAQIKERGGDASLSAHYLAELALAPNLKELMGGAVLIKKTDAPLVSAASD